MAARMEIDTRDLRRAIAGFRALQQPQLRITTSKALVYGATRAVVPAMRREIANAQKGQSPKQRPAWMGKPRRGTAGPLAKSVRAKQLGKRYGGKHGYEELVAISVGPRAWYKHLFIKGTQGHTLRGPHGTYRMDGHGAAQVPPQGLTPWHPGSQGNDVITKTAVRIAPVIGATLGAAIIESFDKQMGKKP